MGNSVDFKFRSYNARLGRFISVDPIAKDYPWNSPYAFAENDVIRAIDLEGKEKHVVTTTYGKDGSVTSIKLDNIRNKEGELIDMNVKNDHGLFRPKITDKEVLHIDVRGQDIKFSGADELSPAERKIADRARIHCPTKTTGSAAQIKFHGKIEADVKDVKGRSHYSNEERPPLLHKINFRPNSDEIYGDVDASFGEIVNFLSINKGMSLVISGGTSLELGDRAPVTIGGEAKKDVLAVDLANSRADKIIKILVEKFGIDPGRLFRGDPETGSSPIVTPSKTN